jgi:hypothetical protein
MKTDTPQTFSQLLREGNKFTDRDFMKVLATSHTKLKRLEADPAQFTISDLMLLAQLIERPIKEVMKVVMAQAEAWGGDKAGYRPQVFPAKTEGG